MKVFLSWSGEPSHAVAQALHGWLPTVLPFVEPWLSSEDIEKGARWSPEIASQLESTEFGIICVVPGNLAEPWLNFEAGAISKVLENAHVAPLLVNVDKSEVTGPLAQFQLTVLEKEDVRRLIHAINKNAESALPAEHLDRNFNVCWPGLDAAISVIEFSPSAAPDVDEPSRGPAEPTAELIQILKLIAERGNYILSARHIAHAIQQNNTKTDYYLDQLISKELLNAALSSLEPTTYGLTQKGRAFLVENDIV